MHRRLTLALFLIFLPAAFAIAQRLTGRVLDKESRAPIIGAAIGVTPLLTEGYGADVDGYFSISAVPGKYDVVVAASGYLSQTISGVLVTAGKDAYLEVFLEEKVSTALSDITVSAKRAGLNNDMTLVSGKTFDVQETERYAGSRQDPARMASNLAGVQGANDARNDIIIRGNSPQGVLWRVEDVDVGNLNHFAIPGSTGGPVTLLNNKILANSDFLTGAFPAAFGNSTAGVFDLRMRNGNARRYEVTGQLGFLGTELAAEGPINKKAKRPATFLATYRYSTLRLFESLNVRIGTNSIPNYQDAALRIHIPTGSRSSVAFFGLGGLSKIDLIVSTLTKPSEELYGESDRDQYFTSNTGVAGVAFQSAVSDKTFFKTTVAVTGNDIRAQHDKVFRNAAYGVDSMKYILGYDFKTTTILAHSFINHKISARHTITAGVLFNEYLLDYTDSSRQYPPSLQAWQHRLDYRGSTGLAQAYAQYKWRPTAVLSVTAGLHGQYLTHNGSRALEPRIAARWTPDAVSALSLGYGLHSQMQPLYQYFAHLPQNGAAQRHNEGVGFTRSHHFVAGYDRRVAGLRMRTEAYYQYLFNVPIETRAGSSFSGLNQGASFSRLFPDTLVNKGNGYNYGLELTVERPFSHGWYALFTGSVFSSKARGNDGIYRNTDYNGRYALNLLGGYERPIGKGKTTIIAGGKITWAGGRLYSPADVAASNATGDLVVVDSLRNTLRFPAYFRADAKLGVRINGRRLTHEIAVDLVNVAGIRNVLSLIYSPDLAAQGKDPFIRQYQLGFLPLFYYRVDVGW